MIDCMKYFLMIITSMYYAYEAFRGETNLSAFSNAAQHHFQITTMELSIYPHM